METLKPGTIKLDFLEKIFRNKLNVTLDISLKDRVEKAAKIVETSAKGNLPVYGVNTGFGKLCVSQFDVVFLNVFDFITTRPIPES